VANVKHAANWQVHLKGEADMRHFEFISSIVTASEDDLSIKRDSDFSASADVFVVVSCL
jgi:hypothetical protein